MATHNVEFTVPERPLGKADIIFTVKRDGEAFGRLKISNGSVVWVPKNAKRGRRLAWGRFDTLMEDEGSLE